MLKAVRSALADCEAHANEHPRRRIAELEVRYRDLERAARRRYDATTLAFSAERAAELDAVLLLLEQLVRLLDGEPTGEAP